KNKNIKNYIGYCYYHGQDLERAVQGDGLFLSFGSIDPKKEKEDGPEIGKIIEKELKKYNFKVSWSGTFKERILIEEIDWKNRIKR
ncbi:MAG: hypothetical protein MJB14_05265, partial [Spirochaetes bacterium]|nr:hypothetical protein [Spirochaetota bacterium]